eukprot:scaffold119153_cov34-Tisochrysis_lutea.AAC.2
MELWRAMASRAPDTELPSDPCCEAVCELRSEERVERERRESGSLSNPRHWIRATTPRVKKSGRGGGRVLGGEAHEPFHENGAYRHAVPKDERGEQHRPAVHCDAFGSRAERGGRVVVAQLSRGA